ncbi:hypothetical protein DERP_011392 [Dermatophagoides pteronyssinus]|uniref:Uncharacterized protein n=1 Tax=Dermatophagoides pteronyssinus TaxID=6956 RepID=A0ABQ8J574_DERPT|nr:hypothetical protein DERP_011392 [Dermatophagoides pteronyssinus]
MTNTTEKDKTTTTNNNNGADNNEKQSERIEMQIINDPTDYVESTSQFEERIGNESDISREFHWLDYYTNETYHNEVEWRSSPRFVPGTENRWPMEEIDYAIDFPKYQDFQDTLESVPHESPASSVMAIDGDFGSDDDDQLGDLNNNFDRIRNLNQVRDDNEFDNNNDAIINFYNSEQSEDYDGDYDDNDERPFLRRRRRRHHRSRDSRCTYYSSYDYNTNPNPWWLRHIRIIAPIWFFIFMLVLFVLLLLLKKRTNHQHHNSTTTNNTNLDN